MRYIKNIVLFAVILIAVGLSKVYAVDGVVTTDGIRVRKSPTTESDIVTILNSEAPVEIIEQVGEWYKIKYTATGTYEGYMHSSFIKKTGEGEIPVVNSTSTPTTQPTVEPSVAPSEVPTPQDTTPPQSEQPKVNLLGEKVVNSEAKIYILPLVASSIKDTIKKNTAVSVQDVAGNFAYISYNNNYGWIRTSLLQEKPTAPAYTERTAYVCVSIAIVREKPTTESTQITSLTYNDQVTVIGEEDNFYKVRVNGGEYYMAKSLISDTKQTTSRGSISRQDLEQTQIADKPIVTQETKTTGQVKTSPIGEQMAQMAKSYLGYKYVYGGASPTTGFDCSGLVYYISGKLGCSVSRTADAQANNGVHIEKSNLQPGDLVFFTNYKTNTGIGHVGIYIGNNQFVHASTPTTGVIVSSLNQADYVRRYVTARRIG